MKRCFIVLLILSVSLTIMARSPLTFEERVKAQEAIERVYYSHRIWPKENPQPKPPFEKMVSKEQIEAKVTDYLKKCSALDQFWQRPIIASQLQAEMDRMAKGSKDPATLNELFAALDSDPYLIAECLARPILADRLLADICPDYQERLCQLEKCDINSAFSLEGDMGNIHFDFGENQLFTDSACTEGWMEGLITSPGMPEARASHASVWTGAEMIIWGGSNNSYELNTGGRYNPSTDSWTETSTGVNCPTARGRATAIWTGTEMIIWGGAAYLQTGGRYNPATDLWAATSTGTNCPIGRDFHTAVWTGTEMIIWGGMVKNTYPYETNTGGKYNPNTNTWTATSTGTNCPSIRQKHTSVWTGTEMIVWGGLGNLDVTATGRKYNPSTDTWNTMSSNPGARSSHTAVWTGSEMIIWGGYNSDTGVYQNTGGRYFPAIDTWYDVSTGVDCPSARSNHTAVWTGNEMIIWGGLDGSSSMNTGGRYIPSSNIWSATPTTGLCPSARYNHTGIFLDSQMAIWGGEYPKTATGGIFQFVQLTVHQNEVVCEGESFILTVVPAPSGASFQWYRNGEMISGATTAQVTVSESGEYYVTVDEGGGVSCSSPVFRPAFVNPQPTISGPDSFCQSASLSTQTYDSLQWYLNGSEIPGATSQTYETSTAGSYTVIATSGDCAGYSPAFELDKISPVISNNLASDITPYSNSGILITWSAPTWNDGGTGTRSFSVLRDGIVITADIASTTFSFVDTACIVGVPYLYQVAAINNCGGVTTTAGVTAADLANPVAPMNFTTNIAADISSCNDSGVYVSWTAPTEWGDGGYRTRSYTIMRDEVPIVSGITQNVLSYLDTTGEQAVSYLYQVTAVNGYGLTSTTTGASASDEGTSTLGELAGAEWSGSSFIWDPAATATGYKLYRGVKADLANLKTSTNEGCVRYDGASTSVSLSTDDPSSQTGRFFWYLVTAYDASCEGTAGEGTGFLRDLSSSTTCP